MLDYVHNLWVSYYDPFYWEVVVTCAVIIMAVGAAWFFNVLRPVSGAISFAAIARLFGIRKGQQMERDRENARTRTRDWRWW